MLSTSIPGSGTPASSRVSARFSGVWPPNWMSAGSSASPFGRLGVDDLQHALRVERLEVESGRGIEVGGNGLRVGVDHHRRAAVLAQRLSGLNGAVVELDALPDAHRPGADDQGGRPAHRRSLGRRPGGRVGRVEVGGLGGEFRGAGIDHGKAGA